MASVIRGSGSSSLGGNLDIEGVLTYEDVTSVDSIGIITARSGINVGTGASIFSPDTNELALGTNNVERLRIASGGNIGIGTETPGSPLEVNGGSGLDVATFNSHNADGPLINVQRSGTAIGFVGSGKNLHSATGSIDALALRSQAEFTIATGGATERLRINSAGSVGIGTITPAEILHVEAGWPKQIIKSTNTNTAGSLVFDNKDINTADFLLGQITGKWQGTDVAHINFEAGANTTPKDDGLITFNTSESGGSPQERLRITPAGNITIGAKSDPDWHSSIDALTVGYAGCLYERSFSVGGVAGRNNYVVMGNNFYYGTSGGNKYINNDEASRIMLHAGQFYFQNAAAGTAENATTFTDRLLISPQGDVRMGDTAVTMSDSSAFYSTQWGSVAGYNKCFTIASSNYSNIRLRGNHGVTAEFTLGVGNGTYYMAYDDISNVHRLTCIASTGVVSGDLNDTSDQKLKENITSLADGQINLIKQLRPVNFDWKKGTLKGQSGFIAQEIKAVIPDLVQGEEYVEDDFESVGYSVNTNGLVSHLTKALQEAISKIEALETRLTDAGL